MVVVVMLRMESHCRAWRLGVELGMAGRCVLGVMCEQEIGGLRCVCVAFDCESWQMPPDGPAAIVVVVRFPFAKGPLLAPTGRYHSKTACWRILRGHVSVEHVVLLGEQHRL